MQICYNNCSNNCNNLIYLLNLCYYKAAINFLRIYENDKNSEKKRKCFLFIF